MVPPVAHLNARKNHRFMTGAAGASMTTTLICNIVALMYGRDLSSVCAISHTSGRVCVQAGSTGERSPTSGAFNDAARLCRTFLTGNPREKAGTPYSSADTAAGSLGRAYGRPKQPHGLVSISVKHVLAHPVTHRVATIFTRRGPKVFAEYAAHSRIRRKPLRKASDFTGKRVSSCSLLARSRPP